MYVLDRGAEFLPADFFSSDRVCLFDQKSGRVGESRGTIVRGVGGLLREMCEEYDVHMRCLNSMCYTLRVVCEALDIIPPSFCADGVASARTARAEMVREALSDLRGDRDTGTAELGDCKADGVGNMSSVLVERYRELTNHVLLAEDNVKETAELLVERIIQLRNAHETSRQSIDSSRVAFCGAVALLPPDSGAIIEGNDLHEVVSALRTSVTGALKSLRASVECTPICSSAPFDGPLTDLASLLSEECALIGAAFTRAKSYLMSSDYSVGGSLDTRPLILSYGDIADAVARSVECACHERERNAALIEELTRMLASSPRVDVSSSPSFVSEVTPVADAAGAKTATQPVSLQNAKVSLLLSIGDLCSPGSLCTSPSPAPVPPEGDAVVMQQLKQRMAQRAVEAPEMRAAILSSMESLGAQRPPPHAEVHEIVSSFRAITEETCEAVEEILSLVDPSGSRGAAVPRLRDVAGQLRLCVAEWEESRKKSQKLAESIMNVAEPNFRLPSEILPEPTPPQPVQRRFLARKEKPLPVSTADSCAIVLSRSSLSASASAVMSPFESQRSSRPGGENVGGEKEKENEKEEAEKEEEEQGEEEEEEHREREGEDNHFGRPHGEARLEDESAEDPFPDHEALNARMQWIRQMTHACGAAVALLGDDEDYSTRVELLPERLLLRVQDVHEARLILQDTAPLYEKYEKVDHELCEPSAVVESRSMPNAEKASEGQDSAAPGLASQVAAVVAALRTLHHEKCALLDVVTAHDRQKALLLRETEALQHRMSTTAHQRDIAELLRSCEAARDATASAETKVRDALRECCQDSAARLNAATGAFALLEVEREHILCALQKERAAAEQYKCETEERDAAYEADMAELKLRVGELSNAVRQKLHADAVTEMELQEAECAMDHNRQELYKMAIEKTEATTRVMQIRQTMHTEIEYQRKLELESHSL